MRFVALDFETTGVAAGYPNEPWQLGLVAVEDGRVLAETKWETYFQVDASRPFSPRAPGRWAQLREELLPDAKQGLLIRTAIQKIAALESIVAEDAEIERAQQEICRQNNINLDQLDDDSVGAFEQAVIQTVVARKVLALVRAEATVKEKTV